MFLFCALYLHRGEWGEDIFNSNEADMERWSMKELLSTETEQYSLCVFECDCGFHLGLDASYLDQIGDLQVKCPSCGELFDTSEVII